MNPTNTKGAARLFLKHIYEKLGESQQSMKPIDYNAIASQIGLDHAQTGAAIRQLKADLLIRFYPESTEIIVLTQKGIQEGEYLSLGRNIHN